jgi:hypothetical protein
LAQAKREKEAAAAAKKQEDEVQSLLCTRHACAKLPCAQDSAPSSGMALLTIVIGCTEAAPTSHSMHVRSNRTGVFLFAFAPFRGRML